MRTLPDDGKSLGQKRIERLAVRQPILKLRSLGFQSVVGEGLDGRSQGVDTLNQRLNFFDFLGIWVAKCPRKHAHRMSASYARTMFWANLGMTPLINFFLFTLCQCLAQMVARR